MAMLVYWGDSPWRRERGIFVVDGLPPLWVLQVVAAMTVGRLLGDGVLLML